jgi:hypothetical protein
MQDLKQGIILVVGQSMRVNTHVILEEGSNSIHTKSADQALPLAAIVSLELSSRCLAVRV